MKLAITSVIKKGIKYFLVRYQRDGRRKESYFRLMPDARNFVTKMRRDLAQHGHAGNLAPDKRADAITALATLEGSGLSLTEAAKLALTDRKSVV